MAIINRLARLFKADFHAVLDHIEEPVLQLKQSVREMQEEVEKVSAQIQIRSRELDNLADRQQAAHRLLKKTNHEIEVCIENNNDELARGLVRRKLETKSVLASLDEAHKKANKRRTELQNEHKEYVAALESMQQKADLLAAEPMRSTVSADAGICISDADVEVALLKERQRLSADANTNTTSSS